MNIIMHIGVLKTGTTALQKILQENRQLLINKKKFIYTIPFANKYNSFIRESEKEFNDIESSSGDDDATYIISNEGIYVMPVHNIIRKKICRKKNIIKKDDYINLRINFLKKYYNIYSGHNIHIIIYLRRQDQLLDSWCRQIAKSMNTEIQLKDVKKYLLHYCDYDLNLSIIKSIFKSAKISVRIYEKAQLIGGNTISDFIRFLNIPIDEKYFLVRDNISFSRDATELKLACEQYANFEMRPLESIYLLGIFDKFTRKDLPQALFSPAERQEIYDDFRESNRRVAQEWLGRDFLFTEPQWDDAYRPWPALSAEERLRCFSQALGAVTRDLFEKRRAVNRALQPQAACLEKSGLFDEAYYRRKYLRDRQEIYAPVVHFLLFGAQAGYNPHPDFHMRWYLSQHPEIAASGLNPLMWHLLVGKAKKFATKPE